MPYHGLLDWRLGLSIIRILASCKYSCGLDNNFEYPELTGWPELARSLRDSFCETFSNCVPIELGPLPGLEVGSRIALITHPLWDTERPAGLLAEAISELSPEADPSFIDTFNILRRPSWTYKSIGR